MQFKDCMQRELLSIQGQCKEERNKLVLKAAARLHMSRKFPYLCATFKSVERFE